MAAQRRPLALGSPSTVLFLALFASQAGVLALSPILAQVADDLGVSIAAAGQLRVVAAPLAAAVAVLAGRALGRFSPRLLLAVGSVFLAGGSLASAAAPTFALMALAQVPLWIGIATLLVAAVAATAAWSTPETRTRLVSHAFAGPPAAWIVGMPIIGLVANVHWRLAFLAVPLPAAVLAGVAVLRRAPDQPLARAGGSLVDLLRGATARRWAIGELCANAAWAGTLVYSGALFTEHYGLSTAVTGVVLAGLAVAYLVGNRWGGRLSGDARRNVLGGSIAAGAAVGLTWAVTPAVAVTILLFAVTSAIVAMRTVAGTVYGFEVSDGRDRSVGAVRGATTQLGYLAGSLAGGVALALGGFALLAVAFGGLFVAATLPYVSLRSALRLRAAAGLAR
ncbi:MAG: MFS transporter [Gaiella sp.]